MKGQYYCVLADRSEVYRAHDKFKYSNILVRGKYDKPCKFMIPVICFQFFIEFFFLFMLFYFELSMAHFENDNDDLQSFPVSDGSIINIKFLKQFIVNLLKCSFRLYFT